MVANEYGWLMVVRTATAEANGSASDATAAGVHPFPALDAKRHDPRDQAVPISRASTDSAFRINISNNGHRHRLRELANGRGPMSTARLH